MFIYQSIKNIKINFQQESDAKKSQKSEKWIKRLIKMLHETCSASPATFPSLLESTQQKIN